MWAAAQDGSANRLESEGTMAQVIREDRLEGRPFAELKDRLRAAIVENEESR